MIDVICYYFIGVLQLTIAMMLREFMNIQKIFTLEQLNSRITSFCYGPIDRSNKPTILKNVPSESGFRQSGQYH